MNKRRTKHLCFGTGGQWCDWIHDNCRECLKSILKKENATHKDYSCSIERDIDLQSCTVKLVWRRSWDATHHLICPYKKTGHVKPMSKLKKINRI